MSTDLHERLHEALTTTEIPLHRPTLARDAVLTARRARRRRRVVAGSVAAAAAAAAVVAAAVLVPLAAGGRTAPATTAPTGAATPAPAPVVPLPDAETHLVDGRLQVTTPVVVDSSSVVLVPEVYRPGGTSTVELVAEQSPRAGEDDLALLGSSVVVTADDASPGWTLAPVLRPNGTFTGQVVVYGVLPPGVTEMTATLPGAVDLGPITWNRVDGGVLPGAPVPAWGEHRDVFAFSATDPGLADQPAATTTVDVDVSVEARIGGEWVVLDRAG